ncbi:MAG: amylo-alpha-1,6-glucosidase, partial [Bacteroidota bacterium]
VSLVNVGIDVQFPGDGAPQLSLRMVGAQVNINQSIYQNFYLPVETSRGLNDHEGHVHVGDFTATLSPGTSLTFMASTEPGAQLDDQALNRRLQRDDQLLQDWQQQKPAGTAPTPAWINQLALTADQFIVKRHSANNAETKSVIAGYHWFEDWGRDTMISLPGLTLATGRHQDAAAILATFAEFIDQGMLPNRFPDAGEEPQYNTVDATLWYFQAIRSYYETTQDKDLLAKLLPKLTDIIDWHLKGTRYGIKVDPTDNLLRGGEAGVQLTWMDAKVNDQVITPRIGKPVEVNALWYNALKATAYFARELGQDATKYDQLAAATQAGFNRFWNEQKGFCFDVLDGPQGNEEHLRPNQLFAISLPEPLLSKEQQKTIVDTCSAALLTSNGLRTLATNDSDYKGAYGGDQYHRDSAYHQGTVWAWLLGPFVKAHLRVYQDTEAAFRYLAPLEDHLLSAGLGTISEIFTGDAPFTPKGCISQAWSVAQVLETYQLLTSTKQ